MKRIRSIVLVACTALALTAVAGAGTASASLIVPETGAIMLKAPPTYLEMRMQGNSFNCEEGMSLETVAYQTNTLEASVGDGHCNLWGSPQLKMNGCKFIFHPGAEESAGRFGGTFDIGPTKCGPITIVSTACEISINSKTGLTAHYTNVGEGSKAEVVVELLAQALETTGKGGLCSKGGPQEFQGTWHLKAYDASGFTQKGVHVAPVGVYINGEKSEKEVSQPKFNAEEYSAMITGGQSTENVFTTEAGKINCKTVGVAGSMSQSTPELSLEPTFSGCESLELINTVRTNGCRYVFHVSNAGPPYTGSLALSCEAGHMLEVSPQVFGGTLCTWTFPAQTLGTTSYTNNGSGPGSYVIAATSGKEIQYSVVNGNGKCGKIGSHSDGKFTGSMKLEGK